METRLGVTKPKLMISIEGGLLQVIVQRRAKKTWSHYPGQ